MTAICKNSFNIYSLPKFIAPHPNPPHPITKQKHLHYCRRCLFVLLKNHATICAQPELWKYARINKLKDFVDIFNFFRVNWKQNQHCKFIQRILSTSTRGIHQFVAVLLRLVMQRRKNKYQMPIHLFQFFSHTLGSASQIFASLNYSFSSSFSSEFFLIYYSRAQL